MKAEMILLYTINTLDFHFVSRAIELNFRDLKKFLT